MNNLAIAMELVFHFVGTVLFSLCIGQIIKEQIAEKKRKEKK